MWKKLFEFDIDKRWDYENCFYITSYLSLQDKSRSLGLILGS
jgi:hypothetical protein